MKIRVLVIIGIVSAVLIGGFAYLQYTYYETWGNNEHWYFHPDGYQVECEMRLFQSPGQCKALDENGIVVDTKTGLGDWNGVIWLEDPEYCEDKGGIWNSTTRGCYGLYEICEKDGGVPRFLKKSLPFPDIEENKPIEYLMDCYHAIMIDDVFLFREPEPRITGKMAQEICSITGGQCPSNYPANIQDDGSVMIGVTTWDAYTKIGKSFVFTIKNNTLSYEVRENEN